MTFFYNAVKQNAVENPGEYSFTLMPISVRLKNRIESVFTLALNRSTSNSGSEPKAGYLGFTSSVPILTISPTVIVPIKDIAANVFSSVYRQWIVPRFIHFPWLLVCYCLV